MTQAIHPELSAIPSTHGERAALTKGFKVVRILLALSAAGLLVMVLGRLTQTPTKEWADAKIAPIVGMTRGYALYQDSQTGVMTGWLYGPVGAIILLPTGLATHPTTARLIGNSITLLCFLAPAAWLLVRAMGRSAPKPAIAPWLYASAILILTWLAVFAEDLNRSAMTAGADGPAVGLAMCSCAFIYRRRNWTTLSLSALAAVLCVWTKQTYALLPVAILLWILAADGFTTAVQFLTAIMGIGAIVSGILILLFGGANMYFHMITLPMNHPLREAELGKLHAWTRSAIDLLQTISYASGFVGVAMLVNAMFRTSAGSLRAWLVEQPWSMLLVVAALLLPGSLAGYAKFGGYVNNLAGPHAFLWLAGLAALLETFSAEQPLAQQLLTGALTMIGAVIAANAIADPVTGLAAMAPTLVHPYSANSEAVFEYCRAHPSEVYCPWDPLITLMAENKLYHFEWGLVDHIYADRTPSDDQYREHLPRLMNKLIYTVEPQSIMTLQVLPEYRQKIQLSELPGCVIYTK